MAPRRSVGVDAAAMTGTIWVAAVVNTASTTASMMSFLVLK